MLRPYIVKFLRNENSTLVVVTEHDLIISFRRLFVSFQTGSRFYLSLSNWKRFPVLMPLVRGKIDDDVTLM